MSSDPKNLPPTALSWNAGGWFGAQIGSTCWIAISAAILVTHDLMVAGVVFALFLAANFIGLLLWRLRDHVSAYVGIQALLIMIGIVSLIAVFVIDHSGYWQAIEGVGGKVSARQMYMLIPAMIFGLLALFWSLNRSRSGGGSGK